MKKSSIRYMISGVAATTALFDVAASPGESKNAMKTNDLIPQHLTLRFYIIKNQNSIPEKFPEILSKFYAVFTKEKFP